MNFQLLQFMHAEHVTSSEINVVLAILKKANQNSPNTKQQATRQSNSLDYVLSDNIIFGWNVHWIYKYFVKIHTNRTVMFAVSFIFSQTYYLHDTFQLQLYSLRKHCVQLFPHISVSYNVTSSQCLQEWKNFNTGEKQFTNEKYLTVYLLFI